MSKLSLQLQSQALQAMAQEKAYYRKLAGFTYIVHPKVYKGSTDTELFCKVLDIKIGGSMWDIGTGTGLVALRGKQMGARRVLATDLNPHAVKNALENSALLKLPIEVHQCNVFGNIKERFDVITFNPPFTNHNSKTGHAISFWDKDHATVKRFFSQLHRHIQKDGRVFIAWSSFGNIRVLKRIAHHYKYTLREVGRKKGKRDFVYYIFKTEPLRGT